MVNVRPKTGKASSRYYPATPEDAGARARVWPKQEPLLFLGLAKIWRLGRGEKHDFFGRRSAEVEVQAQHLATGDRDSGPSPSAASRATSSPTVIGVLTDGELAATVAEPQSLGSIAFDFT
jgi:hypothetical protein